MLFREKLSRRRDVIVVHYNNKTENEQMLRNKIISSLRKLQIGTLNHLIGQYISTAKKNGFVVIGD